MDNRKKRTGSKFKETWRRYCKSPAAMIGLIIFIIMFLVAIFANQIVPYSDAVMQNAKERLMQPSLNNWFGTDAFGRNIFARIVHATPTSLFIGISVAVISLVIGGAMGISSAYYGGKYDDLMMRFIDVLSSIPGTLLSMVVVAVLGANMRNMIIAMVIARIRISARVSRSAVFGTTSQEYIEAAKCGGSSDIRIMIKHIVPNIMGILLVDTTMSVSASILQAASLSFLGLGVQPPTPEWGSMLNDARTYMRTAPHMMFFPGFAILLASLSISLVGDGLRDALDPRLKS